MRISERTLHPRVVRRNARQRVIHIDGFAPRALLSEGLSELMIGLRQVGVVRAKSDRFPIGRDLPGEISLLSECDAQLEMSKGISGILLYSIAPSRHSPLEGTLLGAGQPQAFPLRPRGWVQTNRFSP